jgi:hypothetical protein
MSEVMGEEWAMAMSVVEILKELGTCRWDAVQNGAAKRCICGS